MINADQNDPTSGWRVPFVSLLLAALVAATSGLVSVQLSRTYYSKASCHYDSAVYRLDALNIFEARQDRGLAAALQQSLRMKDSLDITLRLLFCPKTLLKFYGHLVILLPFATLFFAMGLAFVYRHTRSWLLGLSCAAFLFVFSYVYDAWWGMADYWKDNLAAWLVGSVVLAWILSRHLTRPRWAAVSGIFFGLLTMQRTAAAVYTAILMVPVVVVSLIIRLRQDGLAVTARRFIAFVVPAAVLGGIVVAFQWQDLYRYYFIGGYAYGNRSDVARYLLAGVVPNLVPWHGDLFGGLPYGTGPIALTAVAAAAALAIFFRPRGEQRAAALTALWMIVGLFLVVAGTRSYFHGFFALWTPLWLLLLFVLTSAIPSRRTARVAACALLLVAGAASAAQYRTSAYMNFLLQQTYGAQRKMLEEVYRALITRPTHSAYALLSVEFEVPLLNHAWFVHHMPLERSLIFFTPHDTHFKARYPGRTPDEIVQSEMKNLEQFDGPMCVTFSDPWRARIYCEDPLAGDVIEGFNLYIYKSPHWKAVRRFKTVYGHLIIYQFVKDDLTPERKWENIGGAPTTSKPM